MKNPTLIAQPFAHWIADILARFEDGKPLTCDQLNFLISHEKTLSSHALDLVIKYYLGSRLHNPDKSLSFTIPKEKIKHANAHEIRDAVANLLKYHLSHIDLKMTAEQFFQLKAAGFREIIFWHGPQFLTRTSQFNNAAPLIFYFQWGKLFGVVKMNAHVDQFDLDGNVLIYFEDMDLRSLNQCILDYAAKTCLQPSHHIQPAHTDILTLEDAPHSTLPRPSLYQMPIHDTSSEKTTS